MSYTPADKGRARAAYVHEAMPLEQIVLAHGISFGTLARWKKQAKKDGDDWEKARAASFMAGEGMENVQRAMLAEYITQHKALMDNILTDANMGAGDKVRALGSLADSFNKMVAASRRVLPETNELATALQTLTLLGDFVQTKFPRHAAVFVEILEPFGDEIVKKFG